METPAQKTSKLCELPYFVLEEVFSYLELKTLHDLQLVRKNWRSLMLQLIWRNVDLYWLEKSEFDILDKYGKYIKYTKMNFVSDLTKNPVLTYCPNLNGVSIRGADHDDILKLKKDLDHFPMIRLSSLVIIFYEGLVQPLNLPCKEFPYLESLTLDLYDDADERTFMISTLYNPEVKLFNLKIKMLNPNFMKIISKAFPNLESLEISSRGIRDYDGLGASEADFGKLQQLKLSFGKIHRVVLFHNLFPNPKRLKNLTFFSLDNYEYLMSYIPNDFFSVKWDNLEHLKIQLPDHIDKDIELSRFPSLTSLDICLCHYNNPNYKKVWKVEHLSSLFNLPKLEELCVRGHLTDEAFGFFVNQGLNLRRLTLDMAYDLGSNFLQWLINHNKCLQILHINKKKNRLLFKPDFRSAIKEIKVPADFSFVYLLDAEIHGDDKFKEWVKSSFTNDFID